MPCFYPVKGYKPREPNDAGKFPLGFNAKAAVTGIPTYVSCGRCIGCRLERSRQWAVRCVHEASLYERNCFVTLTFNDDNLARDGSLRKSDFQDFVKRLRKFFNKYEWSKDVAAFVLRKVELGKSGIRYFHCGEYGEVCRVCGLSRTRCVCRRFVRSIGRPHHHACFFNLDFDDKVLWKVTDGVRLYRSGCLERLWPFGYASVGNVTFESAAYVARYVVKKISGQPAASHYAGRLPEYTTMSRRPGIGREWFERFKSDVFPRDVVVIRGGHKCRPPRYYSRCFEETAPEVFDSIKLNRASVATRMRVAMLERERGAKWNAPRELAAREEYAIRRLEMLKRGRADD